MIDRDFFENRDGMVAWILTQPRIFVGFKGMLRGLWKNHRHSIELWLRKQTPANRYLKLQDKEKLPWEPTTFSFLGVLIHILLGLETFIDFSWFWGSKGTKGVVRFGQAKSFIRTTSHTENLDGMPRVSSHPSMQNSRLLFPETMPADSTSADCVPMVRHKYKQFKYKWYNIFFTHGRFFPSEISCMTKIWHLFSLKCHLKCCEMNPCIPLANDLPTNPPGDRSCWWFGTTWRISAPPLVAAETKFGSANLVPCLGVLDVSNEFFLMT